MRIIKIRSLRELLAAEEGTTALIFAMMFLSLIVLLGGGFDLSKHRSESTLIQAALDATAIHMVQEQTIPDDQVEAAARAFFDANTNGIVANIDAFVATREGATFSVQVNAHVDTFFMGLIGIETLPIFSEVGSALSDNTREIALVLDTTGSMAGARLADLKQATNLLLDRLEASSPSASGNYHVGIVPFNQYVRVDPNNFSNQWLDSDGRSTAGLEIFGERVELLELFDHLGEDWKGCLRSRPGSFAFTDTPVEAGNFNTRFMPLFAYDEADDGSYDNNYMADAVVHPDGISSVSSILKYGITPGNGDNPSSWASVSTSINGNLGPNRNCSSEPIIPLTTNLNDIRSTVNSFQARGDTQLTEALVWGQRILSDHPPYTNARPADAADNRKFLIFLSDGINSIDGGNSDLRSTLNTQGYAAIGEQASLLPPSPVEDDINDYLDTEFSAACDSIKAAGTEIIVIRLELNDPASQNLLRNCASGNSNFFDATDSSQLDDIFTELASRVTSARLTQ